MSDSFNGPSSINRTADSREELDRVKQEWLRSGLRIGDAERDLNRARKEATRCAESLRGLETSTGRKAVLRIVGRLSATLDRLRADDARARRNEILAGEELRVAMENKDALRDKVAAMERDLKKPRLCEDRLADFKPAE